MRFENLKMEPQPIFWEELLMLSVPSLVISTFAICSGQAAFCSGVESEGKSKLQQLAEW